MNWLSDSTLDHLRRVAGSDELGTPRYRLLEPIGQGGMGTVYRAEDCELGREVAVKVIKDTRPDPDAAQRMLREAKVIARLEHPGIVPVHDIGRLTDGRLYYVMKLVRGKSLAEHFNSTHSLADRLRVFERVCETVAFAHSRGVIHRDLKPQNIMVGEFGEVLVLDWGVAKLLSTGPGTGEPSTENRQRAPLVALPVEHQGTAQGTVIGTPAYMPPEQARGENDRIDQRSDVYALGAILSFLIHNRLPRALDAVCRKAKAADPAARYENAHALAADVARFLSGRPVSAHREGVLERVSRLAWTYRTALLLIAAYLAMRVLLLFWSGR